MWVKVELKNKKKFREKRVFGICVNGTPLVKKVVDGRSKDCGYKLGAECHIELTIHILGIKEKIGKVNGIFWWGIIRESRIFGGFLVINQYKKVLKSEI